MQRDYKRGFLYAASFLLYAIVYTFINMAIDWWFVTLSVRAVMIVLAPLLVWVLFHVAYAKRKTSKELPRAMWINMIIIGVLITGFSITKIGINEHNSHFDYNRWVSEQDNRQQMIDDFLDHQELIGLTQAEVIDLLGKPNERSEQTFIYYMGYSVIDIVMLVITFEEGRAVKHAIEIS
ncbi:hypothetical protein FHS18_002856 [Paenibacillus phyllosphaerae]|uniref:Uncharacterized protein n=1 Tax=Paenibacillus phyllosphaerae TaxID=274593 RepID=A0A7W5FN91_9BACL|nr:hypothetical protein [Paenibacillus phyllosphaerae]MBB3110789.1 hypothetical protein [Paenibacillus phyllosphaerae]